MTERARARTRRRGPGVAHDRVVRALRSLAGATVDQSDPVATAWDDDGSRPRLLRAAEGHGLASALHLELAARGIEPPLQLVDARRGATARRLAATASLSAIGEALDTAGIPWVTFKGPVLASRYPEPARREMNDLDLLVAGDRLEEAVVRLVGVGLEDLNRNWAGAERHGVGEIPMRDGTVWVDLHWHVVGLAAVRRELDVDPSELLARRGSRTLGGGEVSVFDPTDELWHVALHAAMSGAGLLAWLADVRALTIAEPPDWDELIRRARGRRTAAPVGHVLDRAAHLVDAPVPPEVVQELVGPVALRVRRRVDRRPLPPDLLEQRIARAAPVQLARDDLGGSVRAVRRVTRGRLLARLGRPPRWDVDDPTGPLHWATPSGDHTDRERWYRLAAGAAT